MKKHMKKWLALAMAAVMLFAMAIPAMAAQEDDTVTVEVMFLYPYNNQYLRADLTARTTVTMKAERATALAALKAAEGETNFGIKPLDQSNHDESASDATVLSSIDFTFNRDNGLKDVLIDDESVDEGIIPGEMKSCSWAVAINGRRVEGDLSAITLADKDEIIVYMYDSFLDTKLIQVDASNIAAGILSFYYYDAEGNRMPCTTCPVRFQNDILDLLTTVKVLNPSEQDTIFDPNLPAGMKYSTLFVTDEQGQIWIAPQYLGAEDTLELRLRTFSADFLPHLWEDSMSEEEVAYVNENKSHMYEYSNICLDPLAVVSHDTYNVAGATGDMTVVHVLIGAAALFTLGAVIMWKTKKRVGAE